MPIYEYKCDDCGKAYEQIRRMSDADRDLECPSCKSHDVKRQLSSFATGASAGTGGEMAGCAKPGCGVRRGFA